MRPHPGATERRIAWHFTLLTFAIAGVFSGGLIVAGRFGYAVSNVVSTVPEFLANVPFSIYILSPAIASYVVLRAHRRVTGPLQWIRLVFVLRGRPAGALLAVAALLMYFTIHLCISGPSATALPWTMFLLSLPGNLVIGGMEEAGWMSALQPELDRRWGFVRSSLVVGVIWLLWHVPLFFIPGTNHASGVIDFGMFAVQVLTFRFLYGAIFRAGGGNGVLLCILTHTVFNAASFTLGIPPTSWPGTLAANAAVLALALTAAALFPRSGAAVRR
ncbi:CPBP family intramembrane metalloprotease [Leucobacter massiliensis]|uniref:CPBP family intramembrane metalloprotease n=1 Tax=Leucobacter massiliensis TaxID=1686285 RepID=A0A2S9QP50_9MICO|nr:CPBP family intramembrane metalloprotease [Leucobacter massiliensis]